MEKLLEDYKKVILFYLLVALLSLLMVVRINKINEIANQNIVVESEPIYA